jgi:hypothetical protein
LQRSPSDARSIPEQLLQLIAGCAFAGIFPLFRHKFAPDKIKKLAEIPDRLFKNRIRPPVAALMRHA